MTHFTADAPNLPHRDHYDVVVVGARAAGASTAMLLARHGLSVLAIDRGRYGADIMSTHSLARAGVLQLSRWGLLDRIRAAGTPATRQVVFDYGGDEVAIDISSRGDVDGLYNPRRTVLDPILVDAARDAGAEVLHGVSMRRLVRDGNGRVAGVLIDAGGELREIGARHVVGADGARSRVAEQAGAGVLRREDRGAASIYAYFEGFDDDRIVSHYDAGRVVGVIPTNDDIAVVWAGMPAGRFAARARFDVAAAHAAEVARVPAIADRIGRQRSGFRAFPGTPGFLRQPWGPGWALVGDAGYFKDPVSAHGITDALITAELVADAVAAAHAGQDEAGVFGEMQTHRDAMAAEMMPAVAAAAGLPDDMGVLQRAFRDMGGAMRNEWDLVERRFGSPALV